jgi:multicomponent Na+:H+ antiporter subunit B
VSLTFLEAGLLGLVLVCGLTTALLKDVLSAIIAFAAYSLGIAMLWVTLRAPDVALTEAAIGAGVMSLLLLLTIARTVRPSHEAFTESIRLRTAGVVGAFVLVLGTTIPSLPAIGSPSAPVIDYRVTEYYLANTYAQTGVKNAVTAVLAAYRGFDTLGEATVVFAAGIAVLVVLRREGFT